jgi:Helix-turn-helix domain
MEVRVAESKFLTTEEVCERYRGEISVGTLRNWRAQRVGPSFIKIGKSVLYPVQALDEWDQKNLVICRLSLKLSVTGHEGE